MLFRSVALLTGLRIGSDDGVSKEGESVTVRATTEERDGVQSLLITCYVQGHRIADWNRLRIALAPAEDPEQIYLVPLLNERGQARVMGLACADYRLRAFHRLPFIFWHPLASRQATLHQQQVMQLARGTDGRLVQQVGVRGGSLPTTPMGDSEIGLDEPVRIELGDGLDVTVEPSVDSLSVQPKGGAAIRSYIIRGISDDLLHTDRFGSQAHASTPVELASSDTTAETNDALETGMLEVLWYRSR